VLKQTATTDVARLLMGLYQPSPFDADELLRSKNYPVVGELSKIFAEDFEPELPKLLASLDKTALVILANMKAVDLDADTRGRVLEALVPIAASGKRREAGLKAFARLYRPEFRRLLGGLKFSKAELRLKIQFFARLKTAPRGLTAGFAQSIAGFEGGTAKYALELAALEAAESTITIHRACLDAHPDLAFEPSLAAAGPCFAWNTPEVFCTFTGVIQHSGADVRRRAIAALAAALRQSTTPVQLLAVFALSAIDPCGPNRADARRQLEFAIGYRRQILAKLGQSNPAVEPKSAIPFLVHILTHHRDFELDLPDFPTFAMYLRFFLEPLCAETTNFERILSIFFNLSLLEDVESRTENLVKLCNLASAIVK
jgi:hypothetical protein